MNIGWICPVCGSGVSPSLSRCPCHKSDAEKLGRYPPTPKSGMPTAGTPIDRPLTIDTSQALYYDDAAGRNTPPEWGNL